ncbi:MAG: sigma-54-dependent Fis family transcriptional regulator [Candidatus Lindowbacteria bacterium]|nr:sigma-54-dependent Fis family transcriptional regulator [Candidatus Lindowbacteria bacterium]
MSYKILVADDEPAIVEALCRLLRLEGYEPEGVHDGQAAIEVISKGSIDLLLLDLDMPRKNGLETIKELRQAGNTIPIIMVSGRGTIQTAVEAVKLGADDFIEKPVDDERLLLSLENVLEKSRLKDQVEAFCRDQKVVGPAVADESMKELYDLIPRYGKSGSTILITGETGVGKEVVANLLHQNSERSNSAMVRVNCAALPEGLAESELFGHLRGAFTGASKDRKGRFQLADKGTLFLDEVGELPLALQAKLLRALAEGEFSPLGSERTLKADVRILAATNRDLKKCIADGTFREDLYFRLAVLEVDVPPLRTRLADIETLAQQFLLEFCRKVGRGEMKLSKDALGVLESYAWPGNVRELRNVIERLAVITPTDDISVADVESALPRAADSLRSADNYQPGNLAEAMAQEEIAQLKKAIESSKGNMSEAARKLGIERSHFYKKLKKHGIDPRE